MYLTRGVILFCTIIVFRARYVICSHNIHTHVYNILTYVYIYIYIYIYIYVIPARGPQTVLRFSIVLQ